ncbi:MAG: HEAT repeat domain-containing protein [bacterium]
MSISFKYLPDVSDLPHVISAKIGDVRGLWLAMNISVDLSKIKEYSNIMKKRLVKCWKLIIGSGLIIIVFFTSIVERNGQQDRGQNLIFPPLAYGEEKINKVEKINRLIERAMAGEYIVGEELDEVGKKAGPSLEKLLTHQDLNVQCRALQAIIAIDYKKVPILLEMLPKWLKDEFCEYEIITELGKTKDKRVIEPLVKILENKDISVNVRGFAIDALSMMEDKRVLQALLNGLNDKDPQIRAWSIQGLMPFWSIQRLAPFRDKKAVFMVMELLADSNVRVRSNAVWFLGIANDSLCVPALIKKLDETDVKVKELIIRVLGKMRDERAIL